MNKLFFTPNYIEVQCDRDDTDTQTKMMSFYPVHANRIKTNYKVSTRLAPEILKLLRGIDDRNINTAPLAIQEFFYKELSIRNNVQDLLDNGPKESCVVSSKLTLETHQQLGRELAMYYDKFAFFYDTRTGKTPMSLAIINDDIQKHPEHRWLVICPLILVYNAWMEDAPKFFPELATINCHAATPEKRAQAMAKAGNIYVTNTESFLRYRPQLEKIGFTGAFVDESSDMKSPSSKISKELVDFASKMKRFYLLSGTPAPNGEYEYFMQMRAIDYYAWQTSYTQFKTRYFVNLSYNPQYEKLSLRPDKKEELYDKISDSAIFIDKADVLKLPGREFHAIEYDMPKKLMEKYKSLKNKLYVELGDEMRITAASAGAKLNKLNQVSSGFIMDTRAAKENKYYNTDEQEWYLLDDYRFTELLKLLDSPQLVGKQVLIFANYRREFEIIKSLLGDSCLLVYGATSIEEKNIAIQRFKKGSVQYLVANPASADKGLTLTNCCNVIYFSLNWSYETYKQSYDRIYGDVKIQPNFCNYYVMLARGTIDMVLYNDVLSGKSAASYSVLNHLKPEVVKHEN